MYKHLRVKQLKKGFVVSALLVHFAISGMENPNEMHEFQEGALLEESTHRVTVGNQIKEAFAQWKALVAKAPRLLTTPTFEMAQEVEAEKTSEVFGEIEVEDVASCVLPDTQEVEKVMQVLEQEEALVDSQHEVMGQTVHVTWLHANSRKLYLGGAIALVTFGATVYLYKNGRLTTLVETIKKRPCMSAAVFLATTALSGYFLYKI